MPVVPLRHRGRWIFAALLTLLFAGLLTSMVTNPRFQWPVVYRYLFDSAILDGLAMTIWLTVAAMAIGVVLGTVVALMRISKNPVLGAVASGYLWAFRGTPLLVQLIFWYNLSALYPKITLGFPFGPSLGSFDANTYITVYVAALLGLGLNEGAYMSEIVRSGLNSVPPGQREAAEALGMPGHRVMTRIILPQAMRVIIPPTGNQLIGMLKTTSLVSVIAMQELLYSAQLIYTVNFQTIPLLIVASIWYLVLTTVLSIGQHFLERHFGKSDRRANAAGAGGEDEEKDELAPMGNS
ncbi:amino acid ABC transporter permease [Shinella pollutisoli]|uniref:Amino acid ABC transporter permease n=1 Tax=Shinella pollutisoli TaxID=2250594 RepID=A0ABV7DDI5_9HYPH|nr:amino acid ABC transporter permease [Shinella pollutisoli]